MKKELTNVEHMKYNACWNRTKKFGAVFNDFCNGESAAMTGDYIFKPKIDCINCPYFIENQGLGLKFGDYPKEYMAS